MHIIDTGASARLAPALRSIAWTSAAAWTVAACSSPTHVSFLDAQGPIAAAQRVHFFQALGLLLLFVALPVFVLTAVFLWRYRYSAVTSRYTPKWSYSGWLEIACWLGPTAIVALLAVIVWRDAHLLDPYRPLASAQPPLRVQVIGYDWNWLFVYPDQGIASIGMLAMPTGRPLAMELTSATVMQSLHIPALGSQIYAMGGMVTRLNLQADAAGRFLGDNTMYNGDGFHQQRFTAVAMSPEQFAEWVVGVRLRGGALDASGMRTISRRGTRAELRAALPQIASPDGNLYFRDASPTLFPDVVMATAGGRMGASMQSPRTLAGGALCTGTKTLPPLAALAR